MGRFLNFGIVDLLIILFLASIAGLASFALDMFFGPLFSYAMSLLITITIMAIASHAIEKTGSIALFYTALGFFTYNSNNLGIVGIEKIVSFVLAGLLFEFVFAMLKWKGKSLEANIIISGSLSAASIPFSTALQISTAVAFEKISIIANLVMFSFLIGAIATILALLIWFKLRTKKFLLRWIV